MQTLPAIIFVFLPLVVIGYLFIKAARWSRKKNEEIRKTPDSTRERIFENMKNYGVSKELLIRYYCSTATRAETLLGKSLAIAIIVFIIGIYMFTIYALNSRS